MLIRFYVLLPLFFIFLPVQPIYAETSSIQTNDVEVIFEEPLIKIAREVARIYPAVKEELTKTFHWEVDFRPKIILVRDKNIFRKIVGSDIILAFAVSDRNLIVFDISRIYTKPFTLETTLKHELCHLLLSRNIDRERLPRWLDEGVCQWASGGIAELMAEDGSKALAKAIISDRLMDIRELERFPMDEKSLILAYEESKSFVEYIVSEYGRERMLKVLGDLKEGLSINESIQKNISIGFVDLEKNWHTYIRRKHTWFSYFSNNIYTILFAFAGLITIYGFIRLIRKKRAYKDEEQEEDN